MAKKWRCAEKVPPMAMPMPTLLLPVLLLVLLLAGAAAQQQNRVEPLAGCGRDEQPVAKAGVQTVRCDAGTPQFPERRIGYTLAVPEHCALAGGGCGVIMDVHGFTMSAEEQEICDDMRVRGNAAGFIVLQPSAPVNPNSSLGIPSPDQTGGRDITTRSSSRSSATPWRSSAQIDAVFISQAIRRAGSPHGISSALHRTSVSGRKRRSDCRATLL